MTTDSVGLAEISFQKLYPNESYSRKTRGGGLSQPPGMGRVKAQDWDAEGPGFESSRRNYLHTQSSASCPSPLGR